MLRLLEQRELLNLWRISAFIGVFFEDLLAAPYRLDRTSRFRKNALQVSGYPGGISARREFDEQLAEKDHAHVIARQPPATTVEPGDPFGGRGRGVAGCHVMPDLRSPIFCPLVTDEKNVKINGLLRLGLRRGNRHLGLHWLALNQREP